MSETEQPAHPDCDCGREPHEMHRPGCAYAKSKIEAAIQDQKSRYRAHIETEWRKLNPEQPAQRTWVGLSEQEAAQCWSTSTVRTWQAIEAKLKEKNT